MPKRTEHVHLEYFTTYAVKSTTTSAITTSTPTMSRTIPDECLAMGTLVVTMTADFINQREQEKGLLTVASFLTAPLGKETCISRVMCWVGSAVDAEQIIGRKSCR
jgi:hypothetical protein